MRVVRTLNLVEGKVLFDSQVPILNLLVRAFRLTRKVLHFRASKSAAPGGPNLLSRIEHDVSAVDRFRRSIVPAGGAVVPHCVVVKSPSWRPNPRLSAPLSARSRIPVPRPGCCAVAPDQVYRTARGYLCRRPNGVLHEGSWLRCCGGALFAFRKSRRWSLPPPWQSSCTHGVCAQH
jgi:hypothetical protein